MKGHNRLLWILQVGFGLFFISVGVIHLILPEGLPDQLSWIYDLDDTVHYVAGTAEILGGLGLILPAATRVAPVLTPIAAIGLLVVMVGAMFWHAGRDETTNMIVNAVVGVAMVYIAYGRWVLSPIRRAPASA